MASRKATQLSFSAIAGLRPALLPPTQLVHYRSFDEKIISAFLWMPFNLKRDGSNPGIVLPHGGPTGQAIDSFNKTEAANDIRDPKEEAEHAVAVLKKEGKVVDAHYYPDEGHGFAKRENQIDAIRRTIEWFDPYLKGE